MLIEAFLSDAGWKEARAGLAEYTGFVQDTALTDHVASNPFNVDTEVPKSSPKASTT
jgi:hypothetical protein